MASNEYHFITQWRVQATLEEVAAILGDARDLVRWWPSVYLGVEELEAGDERGVGKQVSLYTKGWLPYTLRWEFTVSEIADDRLTILASGDFVGRGIWTFKQDGADLIITYDWKIRATKPLLRSLSFLLKPIFSANHRWAMRQGEISLKREIARRHAATPEERARVPAPPQPTTSSSLPLLASAGIVIGLVYLLVRQRRRGS